MFRRASTQPRIKIAGLKEVVHSTDSDDKAPLTSKTRNYEKLQAQSLGSIPNLLPHINQRKADERLAGDMIGDELEQDATIWELYQEEAKDFDNEVVDGRNKNLDTMLLFAGLFSAVLTGFIVESKDLLEQDPAEASLELLLYIAQSQQRLEEGTPRSLSPMIEIPPFKAQPYARCINGLWFLSLGLSLCAALIAMLAKEWLMAFTASRPRTPYVDALLHQQRLQGWSRYYAFHIIDFLPTILHFSLVLFSIGLVIYLWVLDYAIAIMIILVLGITVVFYVATAILAAAKAVCPYTTQLSNYLKTAFFSASQPLISKPAPQLIQKLVALKWLAENSRDQTVADCSYQALAGLNLAAAPDATISGSNRQEVQEIDLTSTSQSQYTLLANMFQAVCKQIPEALDPDYRQLSTSQGMLVSRYAIALPHLVQYLERSAVQLAPGGIGELNHWAQIWSKQSPSRAALTALDYAWEETSPYLTADTYALFTATEIRLVEIAASYHHHPDDPSPNALTIISPHTHQTSRVASITEVDMNIIPLFDLRARFSRALFRAGLELNIHAEGNIGFRTDALLHLLRSIQQGLLCPMLNPDTPMSTHQRQNSQSPALPVFESGIAGTGLWKYVGPLDVGDDDGLLVGLIRMVCSAAAGESSELARAAMHSLSVATPLLLRQWLRLSARNASASKLFLLEEASLDLEAVLQATPKIYQIELFDLRIWTMRLLIAIALFAQTCADCEGIARLSDHALQALHQLTGEAASNRNCACSAAERSYLPIVKLIQALYSEETKTDRGGLRYLIKWLSLTTVIGQGTVIQHARNRNITYLQNSDIFCDFLNIWVHVPGMGSELKLITERILGGTMRSALDFLWSPPGIALLVRIEGRLEYAPILARLTERVLTTFVGANPSTYNWQILARNKNLPYFLQIVAPLLNNPEFTDLEHAYLLQSFAYAAYTQLDESSRGTLYFGLNND